jgi:hypothetical protein
MRELPNGYRDAIYMYVNIHLSLMDRIKILVGHDLLVKSITYCEDLVGKVFSESKVTLYRISRLPKERNVEARWEKETGKAHFECESKRRKEEVL